MLWFVNLVYDNLLEYKQGYQLSFVFEPCVQDHQQQCMAAKINVFFLYFKRFLQ